MTRESPQLESLLLPRPKYIERLGGTVELVWTFATRGPYAPQIHAALGDLADPHRPDGTNVAFLGSHRHLPTHVEGYVLEVSDRFSPDDLIVLKRSATLPGVSNALLNARLPKVRIYAWNATGAAHAARTLAQLIRQHGRVLPALRIVDKPAFPTRGVLLDVSRCRIPTMPEFHRIIPLLASLKFNHLQFYTEHTFAYRDHEDVWRGWDPITPDQIRELSALCALHGITLAANQNTFGHMKHWLDHARYAALAETHADFDFYGMVRRGPFSLCPTDPAARAFACGLLDELVPHFLTSPGREPGGALLDSTTAHTLVNIGCDETADVGAGRSRDAVARLGKHAVYADHVASIMRHCLARGWTPQFWADIALDRPEVLDLLPPEAIPLAWGYEPDSPFEKWGGILAATGREWWVCPGTSSWRSITGRTAEREANIEAAARAGVAHGASGFMVCDWGDVGHMQQWPITLNALAHAADAAWTGGQPSFDPRAASLHALDDPSLALAPWLDELGDADQPIRLSARHPDPTLGVPPLLNASALFTALWPARPELATPAALATPEQWRQTQARLEHLAATRPPLTGPNAALVEAELSVTLRLAALAVSHALSADSHGRLRSASAAAQTEVARLWAARFRVAGLNQAAQFWDQLDQRLVAS